jgi:TolB-like protein/class 3 adenylate cyclase
MTSQPSTGLKVLLMTDLVGSVAMQERLGRDAYAELKDQHDALFEDVLAGSSGEVLEQTGDGYFIIFENVREALETALTLQFRLRHGDWAHERPKLRIGIHLGEVTPTIDRATGQPRYAGLNVSLTARLMDLAAGEQILVSRPIYENGKSSLRVHPAAANDPAPTLRWQPHGRYRFKGVEEPVFVFEVGAAEIAPFKRPPGGPKARRTTTLGTRVTGVVAVVALLGLVTAVIWRGPSAPTPESAAAEVTERPAVEDAPVREVLTLAVLPFTNLDEAGDSGFAAGVHDDILTSLAQLAKWQVISRTSVLGYAETPKNIREIGAELGATHLVEGSVRRAGDRVRVTVQLIEAATDRHLWAENFDRELKDVFAIQSEIAKRIANSLLEKLSPGESAQLDRQLTTSVEAYDAYNRAREAWRTATYSSARNDSLVQIIVDLETATATDPGFLEAWSLLSRVHANCVFNDREPIESHREAARFALRRAQRLAPESASALLAEAYFHYWGERNFDTALIPLVKARLANPNNVEILKAEAYILRRKGRFTDSLQLLEAAARLDPRDQITLGNLLSSLDFMGFGDRAYALYARLAKDFPEGFGDPFDRADWAFYHNPIPRHRQALREALEAYQFSAKDAGNHEFSSPSWALLQLGDFAFALQFMEKHWNGLEDPLNPPSYLTNPRMFFAHRAGDLTTAREMAEFNLRNFAELPKRVEETDTLVAWLEGFTREVLGLPVDWGEIARTMEANLEESNDAFLALDQFPGLLVLWSQTDPDYAVKLYRETVESPEIGDPFPLLTTYTSIMPRFFDHPTIQAELAERPKWKAVVENIQANFPKR